MRYPHVLPRRLPRAAVHSRLSAACVSAPVFSPSRRRSKPLGRSDELAEHQFIHSIREGVLASATAELTPRDRPLSGELVRTQVHASVGEFGVVVVSRSRLMPLGIPKQDFRRTKRYRDDNPGDDDPHQTHHKNPHLTRLDRRRVL